MVVVVFADAERTARTAVVQRDAFSYYAHLENGTGKVIPMIPGAGGFIITDIVLSRHVADWALVQEVTSPAGELPPVPSREIKFYRETPTSALSWETGLVLTTGCRAMFTLVLESNEPNIAVTISGYTF
jgi:hypothetical protein